MQKALVMTAGAVILSLGMIGGATAQPSASAAEMVRSLAAQSPIAQEAHWRRCHWVKRCNWRRCYWVRHCHRVW